MRSIICEDKNSLSLSDNMSLVEKYKSKEKNNSYSSNNLWYYYYKNYSLIIW